MPTRIVLLTGVWISIELGMLVQISHSGFLTTNSDYEVSIVIGQAFHATAPTCHAGNLNSAIPSGFLVL